MKKIKLLWITGIFIILFIIICAVHKPFYYRIYLGDRIKGTVSVKIDNEVCPLEDKIILSDSGKITLNDDGTAEISFRAGQYRSYKFDISVLSNEKTVTINCFQHDWWNVQRFELLVRIDTVSNIIVYTGNYSVISEDGSKVYESIDKKQSLQEESLSIFWGL